MRNARLTLLTAFLVLAAFQPAGAQDGLIEAYRRAQEIVRGGSSSSAAASWAVPEWMRVESQRIAAENAQIRARNAVRKAAQRATKPIQKRQYDRALRYLSDAANRAGALDQSQAKNAALYASIEADVHRVRAVKEVFAGNYDKAMFALTQARNADPATEAVTANVERWARELRDAEAEREQKLVELTARIHDLEREKAFAQLREGDTASFEATARKILARDPREANVRAQLALVMLQQQRNHEARDELVKALEVDPRNTLWLNNLGVAAARLDDLDSAEGLYSEAVLVDASNHTALQNRDRLAADRFSVSRTVSREDKVRKAIDERAAWRAEVKAKLEKLELPTSGMIEGSYRELKPGDVLLLEPNDMHSRITAIAEQFYTGRILSWRAEAPASHAMAYLGKDPRGRDLYLDNTSGRGPHVIGQTEFEQRYGARTGFVARPQNKVDGRVLMQTALDAVKKNQGRFIDTGYGVWGKDDAVCSEVAGLAVVKATNGTSQAGVFGHLGPIDITPGDFFDTQHIGKYFVIARLLR